MEICEIQITYDNDKNSEVLVEFPLEDTKFVSLQEQDLKIGELWDEVNNGMYNDFSCVKKMTFYSSDLDNDHRFEAIVMPHSLVDIVLLLDHNQSGHNRYQRTYAAIKHLYYWKGMKTQVLQHCKHCKVCTQQMALKHNLKNKFLNLVCISMDLIVEFHPPSSKDNR